MPIIASPTAKGYRHQIGSSLVKFTKKINITMAIITVMESFDVPIIIASPTVTLPASGLSIPRIILNNV